MKTRVCAVGVIEFEGKFLLCKMPDDRGVYPGQWAIPGGGLEEGEGMLEGLKREIREEVGLEIVEARPLLFSDDRKNKVVGGVDQGEVYMIFLVFWCRAQNPNVQLNEEFEEYAWVGRNEVLGYDLNSKTRDTFVRLGQLVDSGVM